MAIVTGDFAKALWPGVNSWYGDSYAEFPVEYTGLFTTHKSDKNYEEDVGLSGFGLASVKSEGGSITYDTMRQGFTTRYTHVAYGLGFIITREMVEDDQYGVVGKKRAKNLAFSMRVTKETIAANVYNRAFTSGYTGGDGIILCSTLHVNVAGGVWSNLLTVAASLSEASLEDLTIQMHSATTDRGLKMSLKPKCLVFGPSLIYVAKRILGNDLRPATANRDINALVAMNVVGDTKVCHYLTSTTAWWLQTNLPSDGMKHWERRADDFGMDNDFDTENAKYKATARYSFGWTDPRALYGTPGA